MLKKVFQFYSALYGFYFTNEEMNILQKILFKIKRKKKK